MPSTLTLLYPQAAWLLLLLPLLWFVARPRRLPHAVLRSALLGALILALAQPSLIYRSGTAPQLYLVDQRDDLSPQTRALIRLALQRRLTVAPAGHRTVLQLGGAPLAVAADEHRTLAGGSLSAGLTEALRMLPSGAGSITLISDGKSTDPHWERAVEALIDRGIPVDTIAVRDPLRRAFVDDISAPAVRVGERALISVAVEGDGRPHVVTLTSEGRALGTQNFAGAGPATLQFEVPSPRAGFMPLRASMSGASIGGTMDAVLAVQDALPLLYLGERQQGAAAQLQRLLGNSFAVERGDARTIRGAQDLARYPLVMLDDMPAASLPAAARRALEQAVTRRDVGLLVSGGEAAFGMGGYAASSLRPLLPVLPRPEEKFEEPSVALAIVIDTSGSMDGQLIEMAKQIARRTAAKLRPTDQLGVVEFYGNQQWAMPMQPVTDPDGVDRTIAQLKAQGSTILYPAIQEAYYGLKPISARYHHILIISDGGVEENRYQQLLGQIAQDRINVSTVQVGTDASGTESMANWARIGRGRFYSVPDETGLVDVNFRQPQIKPDPDYRPGGQALRDTASPLWWRVAGIPGVPPIDGYARTTARPQAETLLATASGDPVLASWQVGGGRVTALMTEPLGTGSAPWRGWGDYGRWLARVAAMTARQRSSAAITLDRRFDRLHIAVQRLDGKAAPMPALRWLALDGTPLAAPGLLEARAPGLFVGDLPFHADRPALIELHAEAGATVRAADRARSDVSVAGAVRQDHALPLDALARLTGGRFDEVSAAAAAPPRRPGGLTSADLWPWLALLALALYLSDLYFRRTPRRVRPSSAPVAP